MKFIDVLYAKPAIEKLASENLPLKLAYKLYQLIEEINKVLGFYAQERTKCWNDEIKIAALDQMEVPDALPVIDIPVDLDISLTASDINYLKPFIRFKEGDT